MGYSYNFKDLEFDFSDNNYLSHWDFMLSEFFKASKEIKNEFLNAYMREYGVGPYNHMMRSHWYSWQCGNRKVSDTQSYRIYYLMQELLDDSAKHRLGMNEFMMSIKSTIKEFENSRKKTYSTLKSINRIEELIEIFKTELEKIHSLNLKDIKTLIISDEEKNEALELSKYILKIKLQNTFDQVERDFIIFLPFMFKFNRGVFSANYLITLFNIKIDMTKIEINNLYIPKFKIQEILTNSRFQKYSDNYLANELLSLNKEGNKAVSNAFLNENDIELFLTQYEEFKDSKNLVNMNSTYAGEGGSLILKI